MPGSIDNAEVRRLMAEEDAQLVEVLPEREYEVEHLAGAVHISLKDFTEPRLRRLDKNRPVIVYCNDFL